MLFALIFGQLSITVKRNLTRAPATLENEEGFDHIHHRSCSIAHGDINGIDNWSEEGGHGYQIHQAFKELFLDLSLEKSGLRITGQRKKRKKFLKKKELSKSIILSPLV